MAPEIKVDLPQELKDNLDLIKIFPSPTNDDLALMLMGEDSNELRIISIFLLRKIDVDFEVEGEVKTIVFENEDAAQHFVKTLPQMSAVELLSRLGTQYIDVGNETNI